MDSPDMSTQARSTAEASSTLFTLVPSLSLPALFRMTSVPVIIQRSFSAKHFRAARFRAFKHMRLPLFFWCFLTRSQQVFPHVGAVCETDRATFRFIQTRDRLEIISVCRLAMLFEAGFLGKSCTTLLEITLMLPIL